MNGRGEPKGYGGSQPVNEVAASPHDHEILPREHETGPGSCHTTKEGYERTVRKRKRFREYKEIRCSEIVLCSDDRAGSIVRRLIRPCHELPHEWFATMGPVRPLRLAGY